MSEPKTVTAAQLEDWAACREQVATFREEWGESVVLTRAVLLRAVALKLDLDWWAHRALGAEPLRVYEEAAADAWRVYNEAMAEPRRVYNEAMAEPLRVYDEARAEAVAQALGIGDDR